MAASHLSGPLTSTAGFVGAVTGNVTGNVVSSSVNIGSGGALTFVKKGQVTVNIAEVGAGLVVETSITITGAVASDTVIMNPPAALEANVCVVGCFVSAADTVKLRVFNPTGAPIDPASASWEYCLVR